MISRLHSSSAVSCCRTSRRSSARTRTFIGGLLPTQNISDLPDLILHVSWTYLSLRHLSERWSEMVGSSVGLQTRNSRINQILALVEQARAWSHHGSTCGGA